ncbi:hypothetical protein C8R44DRAFT_878850 [Mycena epipterygia]|nr:hypothetical protein C8R44DRAFT_878850 [Mycena epipterygia]
MPFFESSTGVLIKDSNFYDIGGDINVHTAPPMMQQDREALERRSNGGLGHQLEGSERNDGHAGAEDDSPGPQVAEGSDNFYPPYTSPDPWSISIPNSSLPSVPHPFLYPPPPSSIDTSTESLLSPSNPRPYLFSQPQSGFRVDSFNSEQEYTPGSQDPRTASYITGQDPFEPSSYTTLEHIHPPFAYTHPSSTSFPESFPFRNMFEPQSGPGFEPLFYPSGVIDDGSLSRYSTDGHGFYPSAPNRAITSQQSHLEPHSSIPSGPNRLFPGDDGQQWPESNAELISCSDFPWHRPPEGPRTNIHGSTFISGNVNHVQRSGETGLQLLYRASAADALHNSVDRYPQPKCHPETRTEILDSLWNWTSQDYEWTRDAHSSFADSSVSNILWLYGPAGAGKSAIVQTGHASRGNANHLFSTIAYQLAVLLPKLKDYISQIVENDPAIVDKSLSIQLQKLIVEPWRQMIPSSHAVIIIDGLDECDGQNVQQEILRSICHSIHGMNFPVQFLIASRPEPHISEMFHAPPLDKLHCPINVEQSFEDIRKYLLDEFTRILREHHTTMARVSKPWPAAEDIDHLVWKSSGYFIYASTVITFIDDKNFRPSDRLDIIMGLAEPDLESPFAALDQLYTQILSDAPGRPRILRILTVIVAKFDLRVDCIEMLLELKPGDIGLALRGLQSLVKIIDYQTLTVHHASFLDFLNDPTRSGLFYINSQHRSDLARQILKAFSYKYEDPSLNQSRPVAWYFRKEMLEFIISIKPSPDLVSLLQSLNPVFLFNLVASEYVKYRTIVTGILEWLEEIHPHPQGLFELWEDYVFMLQCDYAWSSPRSHVISYDHDYGEILSQAPSQLLKIFHACTITKWSDRKSSLVWTHFLLDFSCDELRKSICPLREIMDTYDGKLDKLFTYASEPNFCPKPASIFRDLSRGQMRTMRSMLDPKLPRNFSWQMRSDWGRVLRSCPPCDDMLRDLRELEFDFPGTSILDYTLSYDFHNILQWLKTFPEPPHDLIARFEDHLQRNILKYGMKKTFDEFEERWMSWRKKIVGSSASFQEVGQVSQYDGALDRPMFS